MGRTLVNDSEEKKPIKKKSFSLSDYKKDKKIDVAHKINLKNGYLFQRHLWK
jgi:hypothetical protein